MSPFEFFFSFYGLLLGFSVAELVGGFARAIHERRAVRFGVLTPMLALFVAIDIASFWNQAWVIFRNAPFNFSLLILGLVVASIFYVAATMVFPRRLDGEGGSDLDTHFWEHRRLVLLSVLGANLIMLSAFMTLLIATGEIATVNLPTVFWVGLVIFNAGGLTAALTPSGRPAGRRVVVAALAILLVYSGFNVARSAAVLFAGAGWSVRGDGPTTGPVR